MLRDHDENENGNGILLWIPLRFCAQREERLPASISSSTTTITNTGKTQEMMLSAHKNVVLALVVVVKS